MSNLIYLFDSNIMIKFWNSYFEKFHELETRKDVEFVIPRDVAMELSKKESVNYHNTPILSERFIKLLPRIIEVNDDINLDKFSESLEGKTTNGGITFYIYGNKISRTDLALIYLCSSNEKYVLVTDDKKLLKSGKLILGDERALNFEQLINKEFE